MAEIKLVAESIQEWENLNEEQLNEGAKELLQNFIKNPEEKKKFIAAYSKQLGKSSSKNLKAALLKLSDENQVKLAKQSLEAIEKDPKKGYPWIQVRDRKIIGAGALGLKKSGLGKELGQ
jgi:hypothetical protein